MNLTLLWYKKQYGVAPEIWKVPYGDHEMYYPKSRNEEVVTKMIKKAQVATGMHSDSQISEVDWPL